MLVIFVFVRDGAKTPNAALYLSRGASDLQSATSFPARAAVVPAFRRGAAVCVTRSLGDASQKGVNVRQFLLELLVSFPFLGFPKI